MRVLQVHTRYRQPGGEDSVVEAERGALERAGHEVWQHTEENPTAPAAAAAALAGSVWNPAAARRIAAALDDVRPHVVHIHNTWFASSPSILSVLRHRRIPVVMTVHNYRLACANALLLRGGVPCEKCLGSGPWPAVRHGCYRGSRSISAVAATGIAVHSGLRTWARSVNRFIVLSEFATQRMVRAGIPLDRLVLGSNFVTDPGVRGAAPSASTDILFVGRITPEKGLGVLLQAWRIAEPAGSRLVIIGDGPDRTQLEREAPRGVEFLGQRPGAEVTDRLLRARALVIPSVWYEMQPVTALEGLAAGTPLVLSDIGGLPEVLGGRSAGWLTPPGDPGALAEVLAQLNDDRAVDEHGGEARRRYLDAFTTSAGVDRLEAVYAAARGGS